MLMEQLTALIVDDDPIARRTVGFALGQEDFNCAYASDGAEALKRMESDQFDLVVTDLCMPNKHGHALAVELLSREHGPIIIIHSSVDDPKLTKDLMARGVDDIVYKPANYAAFAAKTKALVQRRKKANQAGEATARSPRAQTTGNSESATADTPRLPAVQSPVPRVSRAEYERRLANVQHLFPLSSAAYEVYCLSNLEQASTGKLVSTMLQDAALTADVLRLANSALYNRTTHPTIDVEEAVVRIGFKKVGEVALALNALAAFRGCVLPWLDADAGQSRSLAASIALERYCEKRDFRTANDGMTLCAFLHPLGRLLLGSAFQDEYRSLIAACLEHQVSLSTLESHVFPGSHMAALHHVLSQWNVAADIWEPLRHLGTSFESIARIEEPIRSRVELIKLAIFIGDVAAARWMPWDHIEPPPREVLSRHQLSHLAPLIEQTRKDLGEVADSHKSQSVPVGFGHSSHVMGERTHGLRYTNLSGNHGDWMPLLLASLGIETVSHELGKEEGSGGILVNCVNATPAEVTEAIRRKDWGDLKPLFLIAASDPIEFEKIGTTTRFPKSAAALRTSCEQFANSMAPPKT